MRVRDAFESPAPTAEGQAHIEQLISVLNTSNGLIMRRPRLWEIAVFFKCPVMGLCLDSAEQKRLIKKAGKPSGKYTSYEIHEFLVSAADSENVLSCKTENLLNRKYRETVKRTADLDEAEFMQRWQQCFDSGEWRAMLWAAATHPHLSLDGQLSVFGDVHMAMHDNAEQICRLKRQLKLREKECASVSLRFKDAQKDRRRLQAENQALKAALEGFEAQRVWLENEKKAIENEKNKLGDGKIAELENENMRLLEDLENLMEEKKALRKQAGEFERENDRLVAKLDEQVKMSANFKAEAQKLIQAISDLKVLNHQTCNAGCPSFNLCRKRVLIVGGITRMEAAYRQLIEGSGGIFEYHDGYMKKGARKLQESLKRADLVLCPVTCNSHGACLMVKKLAKKHNKAVHMLPASSLTAISEAIQGDGGTTIGVQPE